MKRIRLLVLVLLTAVLVLQSQTRRPAPAGQPAREQDAFNAVAKLEDQMRLASLKGDATWWDEYLADSYAEIDAHGKVSNKTETVAMRRSPELNLEIMNFSERAVRTFNGDAVIVTGKVTIEGKYKDESLSGDYQFTRVWIKSGLDWRLAASQSTRLGP
jgi:hypothetical protein